MHTIAAILFDLGGVLVRLRGHRVLLAYLPESMTSEELLNRWLHSPVVRDFESGRIQLSDFCRDILSDLGLNMDETEFLEVFRTFLDEPYPGVSAVLPDLSRRYVTGVLSNTSEPHWQTAVGMLPELLTVRHLFLSYQMGLLKPDEAIFAEVLHHLHLSAEQVLYFDDHPANVEAARRMGIQAVRVDGFGEAVEAMAALGLLEP